MLTDTKLKNLKGNKKLYKVTDRDGLYVAVSPKGTVTFRLDYRLNGRRETLTIGRYGSAAGLTLAEARAACLKAKAEIAEGHSPAQAKQREKRSGRGANTFGDFAKAWLADQIGALAASTHSSYSFILERWVCERARPPGPASFRPNSYWHRFTNRPSPSLRDVRRGRGLDPFFTRREQPAAHAGLARPDAHPGLPLQLRADSSMFRNQAASAASFGLVPDHARHKKYRAPRTIR